MANPGADLSNVHADDVLAAARQVEIEDVVETLARFGPTKVAVEHPHDHPLTDRYASYREGTLTPDPSETVQLGFRLAERTGLTDVHPIDVVSSFHEPGFDELISEASHAALWASLQWEGSVQAAQVSAILRESTIGDVLRYLNRADERSRSIRPYLDQLVQIAAAPNWAGPDMAANWFQRNFRIAATLHHLVESGDRIVVIFGAGHIPVLEQVLRASERFAVVDPIDYL